MNEMDRLREVAVDALDKLLKHRYEPHFQKFVDALADYVIVRTEHDDASRGKPGGLM